jgi:hypothetical protein
MANDPGNGVGQRVLIVRDDGQPDTIAGRWYASYDGAYTVLERYYGDLCCSDEREYYRIVAADRQPPAPVDGGHRPEP